MLGGIIFGDIVYDDIDVNSLFVGLVFSFILECVEVEGVSGSLCILFSDLMSDKIVNFVIIDGSV